LTTAYTWWDAFIGAMPGSIGETSTLAIMIGGGILLIMGIADRKSVV